MNLTGPAAARLYDDHVDAIYTYVARRVGPDMAIDVVGDVFEQALRMQQQQQFEITGSELGWLLAITTALLRRHSALEQSRLKNWNAGEQSARARRNVSDPLLSSDTVRDRSVDTAAVMAAVAELEPADRDLLMLIAWESCTPGVVAEALGIPKRQVRSRLSGVRRELKRRVAADRGASDRGAAE